LNHAVILLGKVSKTRQQEELPSPIA